MRNDPPASRTTRTITIASDGARVVSKKTKQRGVAKNPISGPFACSSMSELFAYYGQPVSSHEVAGVVARRAVNGLSWDHDLPTWKDAAQKLGDGGMPFDETDLTEETGVLFSSRNLSTLASLARSLGLRLRWRLEPIGNRKGSDQDVDD